MTEILLKYSELSEGWEIAIFSVLAPLFISAIYFLFKKIISSNKANKNQVVSNFTQSTSGHNSPIVNTEEGNIQINYNNKTEYKLPNIYGEEYPVARTLLIKSGWIPKRHHWSHGSSVDIQYGNGSYYWDKGYHELCYCSGTGYGMCRFEFQDPKRNLLVIITSGEVHISEDYESQATVSGIYLNPENEEGAYVETIGAEMVSADELQDILKGIK